MLHPPVRELAQAPVLVAAFGHAQDSVKVAQPHEARLLAVRHGVDRNETAEHQRHQRHAHRKIAAGPLRQRPAPHPREESQDARRAQCDQVLGVFGKNSRRDDGHQDTAQRPARRYGQIERRQMTRHGPRARQFAMAHHAGDEQRRQIHGHLFPHRDRDAHAHHRARDRRHHAGQHREHAPTIPAVALERQDERQQVERQRCNPQERDHRDFLRDLIGGPQQQHRAADREAKPQQDVDQPWTLRRFRGLLDRLCLRVAEFPRRPSAQRRKDRVKPRPDPRLRAQLQERLQQKRIAEQRQKRPEVRERVQSPRRVRRPLHVKPALQ